MSEFPYFSNNNNYSKVSSQPKLCVFRLQRTVPLYSEFLFYSFPVFNVIDYAVSPILQVLMMYKIHHPIFRNFFFEIPLCKLYTNCLLSTLNARATLWNSSQSHSYSHSPMPNRSGGLSMEVMSPTKGKHDSKLLDPCPDVEYGITITKVRCSLLGLVS